MYHLLCIHGKEEIKAKQLKGFFVGGEKKLGLKIPYLRKSYQSKREVGSILDAGIARHIDPGSSSYDHRRCNRNTVGVIAAVKKNTWVDTSAIFSSIVGYQRHHFLWESLLPTSLDFVLERLDRAAYLR